MDSQQALRKVPKEFIIQAEDLKQIYEVLETQVISGPARKIEGILRKIKPYTPPAPPKPDPEPKPVLRATKKPSSNEK